MNEQVLLQKLHNLMSERRNEIDLLQSQINKLQGFCEGYQIVIDVIERMQKDKP